MEDNVFGIDSKVVDSALRHGILVKNPDNTWKMIQGIISLFYLEQLNCYYLTYTTTNNANDAKVVLLSNYKVDWDLKEKI